LENKIIFAIRNNRYHYSWIQICIDKKDKFITKYTRQSIWQRNYYEHIIRNDKDLNNVQDYINNNLMQWHVDEENPNKDDQIAMTSDGIY